MTIIDYTELCYR